MRLKFMIWLYGSSSRVYAATFKFQKKAWGITKVGFTSYPADTLGRALGDFYALNGFDVMPKLENHDVFHVLTGTGTTIQDEIAMQYLLLGNGKISVYLLAMILIGTVLYPEYWRHFFQNFRKGSQYQPFYHMEFQHLLEQPLALLQSILMYKTQNIHV